MAADGNKATTGVNLLSTFLLDPLCETVQFNLATIAPTSERFECDRKPFYDSPKIR